jgi:hypothetical protein
VDVMGERFKMYSKYGYIIVETSVDLALRLLRSIIEKIGGETTDLSDTIRILENFDEYYSLMSKKFKEYLVPQKKESDFIKGRVFIDKIKLSRGHAGEKYVLIQFDRRVKKEFLEDILNNIT